MPSALGLFGLFLGFFPFSIFYRAITKDISELTCGKSNLYPNALRYLRTNLSLHADVSENILPFVSQSINNFSDYDISQSHAYDWECPSLSPHVLLQLHKSAFHFICQADPKAFHRESGDSSLKNFPFNGSG